MAQVTLYHNPQCRHSRSALAWLQNEGRALGIDGITVINYLTKPLTQEQLRLFFDRIDAPLMDFIRVGGDLYKELGLQAAVFDKESMAAILVAHPLLMQRPLVFLGERGMIARDLVKLKAFIEDRMDEETG